MVLLGKTVVHSGPIVSIVSSGDASALYIGSLDGSVSVVHLRGSLIVEASAAAARWCISEHCLDFAAYGHLVQFKLSDLEGMAVHGSDGAEVTTIDQVAVGSWIC